VPAAIVKRSPSPSVIGVPVPTSVGPKPAAVVAIRAPTPIDDPDGGLPAEAIIFDIDPVAVRSKRVVEI